MTQEIFTEEGKKFAVGKIISAKDFNITCRGCKSKFNNFVRFCLTPDSMKWDCHNCDSEFSMFAQDLNLVNETTVKIIVFQKRHGETKQKEYSLINNADFKEIQEKLL